MIMRKKFLILTVLGVIALSAIAYWQCGSDSGQSKMISQKEANIPNTPVMNGGSATNDKPGISNQEAAGEKLGVNKESIINDKPGQSLDKATRVLRLHRIDYSGVYALPNGVSVLSVKINNKPTKQYTITENGELDVFRAHLNSTVTATVK